MLDETTRIAILRLREGGHGTRAIAKAVGISRWAVRAVLSRGSAEVPRVARPEKAEPFRDEILALHARCGGNLVRVHEEIVAGGARLSYQALTAFCRRHGIGFAPKPPSGNYDFAPGKEMQHDTSPHDARIAGRRVRVQTASVVLCYSRMIFIQCFPRFTRFECKLFLTDALRYFGGACETCMIDNTHVVVLSGTGREMVPAPEMAAFADRFGFTFRAHEKGDANRSARVERPFDYIENNFLAGRDFDDLAHLNREALAWCDRVNEKPRRHLHGSARELFAAERPHLRPLPIWVPEVYRLHHRLVDVEGCVSVDRHRYSAPYALIGRRVEVHETKDRIEIFDGPRRVGGHAKLLADRPGRAVLPEHRPPRGRREPKPPPPEETALLAASDDLGAYVAQLKKRASSATLAVRRLARMLREYPRDAFLAAVRTSAQYGLYDLERVERMVLRNVATDFFPEPLPTDLPAPPPPDDPPPARPLPPAVEMPDAIDAAQDDRPDGGEEDDDA